MSNIFVLLAIICVVLLIRGLITGKVTKTPATRKKAALIYGGLTLLCLVLVGITAPPTSTLDTISNASDVKSKVDEPEVTTSEVKETEAIAFTTKTQDDGSLALGQTKIVQEGVDGIKTKTYTVTKTDGVETGRVLASEEITTQPIEKVVANGTYVAPKTVSCSNGYTNVDGNCVRSPSSDPAGATAQCVDGTYSYSQNRRGTCSHHGGVARLL